MEVRIDFAKWHYEYSGDRSLICEAFLGEIRKMTGGELAPHLSSVSGIKDDSGGLIQRVCFDFPVSIDPGLGQVKNDG